MPTGGMHVEMRFAEISDAMVKAAYVATDLSLTRLEQDVKGGPRSLYRVYPEKPSYQRTGNLGRSYHRTDVVEKNGYIQGEVGNDVSIADYVVYVEYGTRFMEAEPHLRPAVDAERPIYQADLIWRMKIAAAKKGLGAAGIAGSL